MLTFGTWFFLKIDQVLALGPAPPHWWPELESATDLERMAFNYFGVHFQKKTKWQPNGDGASNGGAQYQRRGAASEMQARCTSRTHSPTKNSQQYICTTTESV